MTNFLKRLSTAILLLVIIYFALLNVLILFLLFFAISLITSIELFNLLKKIFYKKKNRILITYLFSIFYLSVFISQIFFFIIFNDTNKFLFIYLLSVCIGTDLGGYFFGKIFKGRKLIKISPNKTFSGLYGSYLLSFLVFIYFYFKYDLSTIYLLLTFVISSFSQMGDLFISYLKRKAKLKDTGKFLPGHGGVLDRIDGIIFAIPLGINLITLAI